jgi:hypothetical protein
MGHAIGEIELAVGIEVACRLHHAFEFAARGRLSFQRADPYEVVEFGLPKANDAGRKLDEQQVGEAMEVQNGCQVSTCEINSLRPQGGRNKVRRSREKLAAENKTGPP